MGSFSRPKSTPPTDEELYTNLDAAIFTYIETLNDYKQGKNQIIEVVEMSIQEIESTYQIIVDAALSSLSHPTRENLKIKLLESIPKDLLSVRKKIVDTTYLPPPSPPKFSDWIQGHLNEAFPVGKLISDDAYGNLMNLIASAFIQGNPPRDMSELTEYENNLITLLFVGTHKGFESASDIKGLRAQANRHLAQIFALTLILGIKFSLDNNLKAEE
ncbi:unannotated protein [freshwater metagenome]|uniref:Unannotated protein n=1 Tax=freshwater metagenome TaxID=449393 RepID=A0A6J6FAF7_9ZZZZ|nr:hypothetical protein [Actinomycetota bacterium]